MAELDSEGNIDRIMNVDEKKRIDFLNFYAF